MKIILTDRADRYRDRPWSLPWKLVTLSFLPTGQPISQTICVRLVHERRSHERRSTDEEYMLDSSRLSFALVRHNARATNGTASRTAVCLSVRATFRLRCFFLLESGVAARGATNDTTRGGCASAYVRSFVCTVLFVCAVMSRTSNTIALRSPQAHLLRKAWRA